MQPETFNVRFSLYKFLRDLMTEHFDTQVFWNRVKLPSDERRMESLTHYLVIDMTRQTTNVLQDIDVSLYLFATPALDPHGLWIQDMPDQVNQYAMQCKTRPDLNMIAMYDYDQRVGQTALTAYRRNGTIPATLLSYLGQSYPAIPYYEPCGQAVGLKLIRYEAARIVTTSTPYNATWRHTYRYFEPRKAEGAVIFT